VRISCSGASIADISVAVAFRNLAVAVGLTRADGQDLRLGPRSTPAPARQTHRIADA